MKGRGVRIIGDTDFQAVTPDAAAKTRFVIVDAVGVTETDLNDTQPLDRKPTVPLDKLFKQISFGVRDPDVVSTIAGRLARLDRRLTKDDREELEQLAGGLSLQDISARDRRGARPRPARRTGAPAGTRSTRPVAPLATNPELRERIIEVRRSYEQAIDETSVDVLIDAGHSKDGTDRARATVESFERFIEEHKDEITALQILYSRPYTQRLTFKEVKELANAIGRPPYQWTPEKLWAAYEALDRSKVHGSGQRVLTDIVSLVRFALHQDDELVPYPTASDERYEAWLLQQENAGRTFTRGAARAGSTASATTSPASLGISPDDFAVHALRRSRRARQGRAGIRLELTALLDEMNEALVV